ncbi:MAG: hypothetical protein ACK418_22850 [Pseudomonas sp.]|uniref:hypothetical protein n=1 Tax=Pseudomonas sp. TaxID=306 RepID=UPI00391DCF3D
MSAALQLRYTNDVSAEFLNQLNKSPFTEQQLSNFNERALARFKEQRAYQNAHLAWRRTFSRPMNDETTGAALHDPVQCRVNVLGP